MEKKNYLLLTITLAVASVLFYILLFMLQDNTNSYYSHFKYFKALIIIIPLLFTSGTTIFLSGKFLNPNKKRLDDLRYAQTRKIRITYVLFIVVICFCSILFLRKYLTTRPIQIQSNLPAKVEIKIGSSVESIGIVNANSLVEIRIPKDIVHLTFTNGKEIIIKEIGPINEIGPILIFFSKYTTESPPLTKSISKTIAPDTLVTKISGTQSSHDPININALAGLNIIQEQRDRLKEYVLRIDRGGYPTRLDEIYDKIAGFTSWGLSFERSLGIVYWGCFDEGYAHEWSYGAMLSIIEKKKNNFAILIKNEFKKSGPLEQILLIKLSELLLSRDPHYYMQIRHLICNANTIRDEEIMDAARMLCRKQKLNHLTDLFNKKYDSLIKIRESNVPQINISNIEIAEQFSLCKKTKIGQTYHVNIPFETDEDNIGYLIESYSPYGELVRITDKITRKESLTLMESTFLEMSKPVLKITINNNKDSDILLENIIVHVDSIESVDGGCSTKLRPEIMYELVIPNQTGTFFFTPEREQLLVKSKSYEQVYLGLNSSKTVYLKNGAVLQVQQYYHLRLIFDFGKYGMSDAANIVVLF